MPQILSSELKLLNPEYSLKKKSKKKLMDGACNGFLRLDAFFLPNNFFFYLYVFNFFKFIYLFLHFVCVIMHIFTPAIAQLAAKQNRTIPHDVTVHQSEAQMAHDVKQYVTDPFLLC